MVDGVLVADSFLERNGTLLQIIAALVIAIGGGLIGRYLHSRDKSTKTFDYAVISDLSILSNRPDDDDLKVTYMGAEVHNPRIVRVRFTNTGKQVIKDTDLLDPYVINQDKGRKIAGHDYY